MKITVLASGSKGNATYIETNNIRLLVDAGISFKQLSEKTFKNKIKLNELDALLLTHEHVDHAKGMPMVLKHTEANLYTTRTIYNHLCEKTSYHISPHKFREITIQDPFILGDIEITPLSISHDAVETIGFVMMHQGKKVVYMTDVGFLPGKDYNQIKNADAYFFEANYDVSMLFSSARPYFLKQRIDSVRGHLSNTDSAYHLSRLVGDKTKTIVLMHPSLECNNEQLALNTLSEVFNDYEMDINGYDVYVAKQFDCLTTIIL